MNNLKKKIETLSTFNKTALFKQVYTILSLKWKCSLFSIKIIANVALMRLYEQEAPLSPVLTISDSDLFTKNILYRNFPPLDGK